MADKEETPIEKKVRETHAGVCACDDWRHCDGTTAPIEKDDHEHA